MNFTFNVTNREVINDDIVLFHRVPLGSMFDEVDSTDVSYIPIASITPPGNLSVENLANHHDIVEFVFMNSQNIEDSWSSMGSQDHHENFNIIAKLEEQASSNTKKSLEMRSTSVGDLVKVGDIYYTIKPMAIKSITKKPKIEFTKVIEI